MSIDYAAYLEKERQRKIRVARGDLSHLLPVHPRQAARLIAALARTNPDGARMLRDRILHAAEKQQQKSTPVAAFATGTVHTNCSCSRACAEAWSARLQAEQGRLLAARGMSIAAAQLRTNIHLSDEVSMTPAEIRQDADHAVAKSLAAIRASKTTRTLRTTEGKRNSSADQARLDAAHAALVEAGASCGDNPTAQSAGAAPEHQQLLDAAHESLVQAGAACDNPITSGTKEVTDPNAGADNLPRNAEARLNPPDPYAAALAKRRAAQAPSRADTIARNAEVRAAQTADIDPNYNPRGVPPDGYAIGLAVRRALKESTQHD